MAGVGVDGHSQSHAIAGDLGDVEQEVVIPVERQIGVQREAETISGVVAVPRHCCYCLPGSFG